MEIWSFALQLIILRPNVTIFTMNMKNLSKALAVIAVTGTLYSCNSKTDEGKVLPDQEVAVALTTEENGQIDIKNIPLSDKELGQFPYLNLPTNTKLQNNAIEREIDRLFFPINGKMQAIEGKIWKANIVTSSGSSSEWSLVAFEKHFEDKLTQLGAVKIFDAKVPTSELDRIKDQATYFGEEGSIDYWNEPVKVYVIRREKQDDVYVQLSGNSASGKIQILQRLAVEQMDAPAE